MSRPATAAAPVMPAVLARIVEHYHQTFCTSRVAQAYLARRGLTDPALLKTFQIGRLRRRLAADARPADWRRA